MEICCMITKKMVRVYLLKFFHAVLLFLTTADTAGNDWCINFIHFNFFFALKFLLHFLLWCCIFYFDVEFSTLITLNFFYLHLAFFDHNVAFSSMITFSTSSDVVVSTMNNFHLFCFTDIFFLDDIIFAPWCRIFYLDVAFSILINVIFYLHVAFSIT